MVWGGGLEAVLTKADCRLQNVNICVIWVTEGLPAKFCAGL